MTLSLTEHRFAILTAWDEFVHRRPDGEAYTRCGPDCHKRWVSGKNALPSKEQFFKIACKHARYGFSHIPALTIGFGNFFPKEKAIAATGMVYNLAGPADSLRHFAIRGRLRHRLLATTAQLADEYALIDKALQAGALKDLAPSYRETLDARTSKQ